MLHTLRRLTAGTAPLAVVALLAACGPPVATNVAVAPVVTPTLALPGPAPTIIAPAPTPATKPALEPAPTAAPVVKPAPAPTPKPLAKSAPKPAVKLAPKPVVKPAPKPSPRPAPAPAQRTYSKPAVSTGGCAFYDMALPDPALRNLPAFTVRSDGRAMLTHAAGGSKLTASISGSWHFAGPFEIAPSHGKEATLTNTRAGIRGSFTTGGHTYSFAGSWPYCA